MSEEATPQPEPIPEQQVEQRSLGAVLSQAAEIVAEGTVIGTTTGVAGALTHHWLQGDKEAESEPAPKPVEFPSGVHVEDD
jgi:hypothetical protein